MDLSWSTIYLLIEWFIRISMLIYVPQQRAPNSARAWLLLIFFLPVAGIVLYAWLGRIYIPRQRAQLYNDAARAVDQAQQQLIHTMPQLFATKSIEPPDLQNTIHAVTKIGGMPVTDGNQIEILHGYEVLIASLIEDIDNAQHSIHLLYYIYGNDQTGERLTNALSNAAKRGVKIRVLLDAIGARQGLKHQAPKLRAAGIEVHAAFPVGFIGKKAARIDLRNHRKIAMIDGRIAHMGSQNIVDPTFIPGLPNEELNIRITGTAVCQLQAVFLADLYSETQTQVPVQEIPDLFHIPPSSAIKKGCLAQVVPSGPGYGGEVNRNVMITLVYAAQKNICMVTPYFIPDEPFQTALMLAARRGVHVQLIFPKHSNHLIVNLAQQSYFTSLMSYGVEIYLYRPGLLHAKHIAFDDHIALVGSPNMDVRSFALNSEISTVIYDSTMTAQLRDIQRNYIGQSDLIDLKQWYQRPRIQKFASNLARLTDGLL